MKPPISLVDTKADKLQQDKAEVQNAIQYITSIIPEQIQVFALHAKMLKAKKDALMQEGFSEEQAMEIVKTRPIFE
ncbi:hypothetical protein [Sporosarcina trichiuri]|uniref:hypothetical protein n=1 Tax=Sporosarcina trichiuri TaxID=3056445 RepID=UPI0025B3AF7C|nr:hypothetical protein [Sporosarcina sp. 0.2-SM1T-5]WJY27427.1 hypothetical protein QWT68_15520 [Sporosarcina sp. 0.2-SM1T-5]WJY27447.1 hypothetical protein QWT68_00040 [Sporosarcina sp. 0.2-SM1T-5]